eukprot:TRINITY_DN32903_c0_g1_i1.p2 TRINITY_DN32903_c0_g1~~TRINITY_DN32903_c0_g1_i1.p2  ORF type:complete len:142 (-),score=7.92 TRINITY_DN32903_c0_g1_i1:359-784(-)
MDEAPLIVLPGFTSLLPMQNFAKCLLLLLHVYFHFPLYYPVFCFYRLFLPLSFPKPPSIQSRKKAMQLQSLIKDLLGATLCWSNVGRRGAARVGDRRQKNVTWKKAMVGVLKLNAHRYFVEVAFDPSKLVIPDAMMKLLDY